MSDPLAQSYDGSKWIRLLCIATVLILLAPLSFDNIKYIVLPLGISAYWGYTFFNKGLNGMTFTKVHYALITFTALSYLSICWSTDSSAALRQSFIYLLALLSILSITHLVTLDTLFKNQLSKLLAGLFVIYLILHLVAVQIGIGSSVDLQKGIGLSVDWNSFLSKNKYYTTTLLTCLSPYLLFYDSRSQFIRFVKIISIIMMINILFLTGARGAMLAFAVIVMLKFWHFYQHSPLKYPGILAAALFIVAGIYLLNTSDLLENYTFIQEYRSELNSRILMNQNSILTIKEHPLGVGSGNWANHIYAKGVNDISPFNDTQKFVRLRSHNLYFKIATELGLLGLFLSAGGLIALLWGYRDRWTESTYTQKSAWASLVAFLITCYFYTTAFWHDYFFSGIGLIGCISIGLLLAGKPNTKRPTRKTALLGLLIGSLLCTAWFVYMKWRHDTYRSISNNEKERIALLERLYHPILGVSHNMEHAILHDLAVAYQDSGETSQAHEYYKKALEVTPNKEQLLYDYANFLISQSSDLNKAVACLEKILMIQPDHQPTRALLDSMNDG